MKIFHIVCNIVLILFIAIVLGTLLMIGVYCFQPESIKKNILESAPIYEREQLYYSYAPSISSALLDNYTDGIMLNEMLFKKGKDITEIIDNALKNPFYTNEHYNSFDIATLMAANELKDYGIYPYPRYWHGYQVYMKPLLALLTISDIRYFSMCLQFTLLVLLIIELYKKKGYELLLPVLIFIFILNPISSVLCLQYQNLYYITFGAAYILSKKELYKSDTSYIYLFLFIGILTSFLDLSSFPIVGLTFNLMLFLILTNNSLLIRFKQIIIASTSWFFGFAGMMIGKWSIATLLTDMNVIKDGIDSSIYRLNGYIEWFPDYNIMNVINSNIKALQHPTIYIILGLILIICIVRLLDKRYLFKFDVDKNIPLILVAIIPFIWYIIVKNHSIVHVFMSHRNLAIVLSILIYIVLSSFSKIPNNKTE